MNYKSQAKKKRLYDRALLELRYKFKPRRVKVGGITVFSPVTFIEATGDSRLESKYESLFLDNQHEIRYFVEKPRNPSEPETKIYYTVTHNEITEP